MPPQSEPAVGLRFCSQEVDMTVMELLQKAEFLVDAQGQKKAVVFDYDLWEELLVLLEDLEDVDEINRLREEGIETISWKDAKSQLRAEGFMVNL
jgi:hypothetical protein